MESRYHYKIKLGPVQLGAMVATVEQLPKPAIRARLGHYASGWTMKDGTQVTIRPIRRDDEPLMVKFHESLSDRSVRLRYFSSFSLSARTDHERLLRVCFVDYDREMALVAEHEDTISATREILGVGRLSRLQNSNDAEIAVLVTDRYQHCGLGTEMVRRLIQIAREQKLNRLVAEMLRENWAMQALVKRLGFHFVMPDEPALVRAVLSLE